MTIKRAHAIFQVKSVDEESRIIEGIATTPTVDSYGDIVEPMGVSFSLPMPLLWQHQHDKPVGNVEFAEATKDGVKFRARLPKILEPGVLKDRVDEAWQSLKANLLRGVSIGFRAQEYEPLKSGGMRFTKWDWYELSLVTLPANTNATIDVIRAADKQLTNPATGKTTSDTSSAGGSATKQIQFNTKEKTTMNYAEQLRLLREKKSANASRMQALIAKSAESGETLDASDAEEFDTLESEVATIDAQIKRVETLERVSASTAQPVEKSANPAAARAPSASRVSVVNREEKGLVLARVARCIAASRGNLQMAEKMAERDYGSDQRVVNITKAAVAAGTTTDPTWVGALVGDESAAFQDFLEFLRPQTILGQFGQGGIPALRNASFRIPMVEQTSGGSGYWVSETNPKPLTKFDFTRTTIEPTKVANIAVLSKEAIRDSNPKADIIVRDQMIEALRSRLDIDFVDPAKAAVAGESPASITNGVTPLVSSGDTYANVLNDIRRMRAALRAGGNVGGSPVLILDTDTAEALAFMLNDLGTARAFPDVTSTGGNIGGFPVIVSDHLLGMRDTAGGIAVMVNANEVYLADEGGFTVDYSDQATLTMDDAPAANATATFSLWQRNCVGILCERSISWAKRRAEAAVYMTGVNWGGAL